MLLLVCSRNVGELYIEEFVAFKLGKCRNVGKLGACDIIVLTVFGVGAISVDNDSDLYCSVQI